VLKVFSRQENRLRADTRGAEVSGRVQIGGGWHLDGALATFHLTPHPMGSLDPSLTDYDGHTPASRWRAHAAIPLSRRGQADIHFFRTGPIDSADVPAIARLDARLEWSLTRQMSLVASGQNLLHPSHLEFNGDKTVLESTEMPRSGGLRLAWRF
jgi:iron complex outermembrane receptor protein